MRGVGWAYQSRLLALPDDQRSLRGVFRIDAETLAQGGVFHFTMTPAPSSAGLRLNPLY